MRYWYLIKWTTNSARVHANWINCLLYKVLLNLHVFPVLNIYCTKLYLGPLQRSYAYLYWQSRGLLIPIKIIFHFFECKIPKRVLFNGAISICRRFSKVSHQFEAKMCGLSLLAIFTFWVFKLWLIKSLRYYARSDWPLRVFTWEYVNIVLASRCFALRALITRAWIWKSFRVQNSPSLLFLPIPSSAETWKIITKKVCQFFFA